MVRQEEREVLFRVATYLAQLAQLADRVGDVLAYEEWNCEAASIAHTLGYAGGKNPFDSHCTGMLHRQFEKGIIDRNWYDSWLDRKMQGPALEGP